MSKKVSFRIGFGHKFTSRTLIERKDGLYVRYDYHLRPVCKTSEGWYEYDKARDGLIYKVYYDSPICDNICRAVRQEDLDRIKHLVNEGELKNLIIYDVNGNVIEEYRT